MSIFDDVVVNAKSAADALGKKATKIADSTKLTITAADLKAEISKKSEILGRVVYVSRTTGKSYEKSIAELVETITELKEQLEAVETQLADARSRKKCPICGLQNPKNAIFCNRCGEKIGEPQTAEDEDLPQPDADEPTETEVNAKIDLVPSDDTQKKTDEETEN